MARSGKYSLLVEIRVSQAMPPATSRVPTTVTGLAPSLTVSRGVNAEAAMNPMGRRAAVRALRPAYSRDEMFPRRFLREWRTTAGLSHPHVMPIYGVGENGGLLYAVMPYIYGGDLRALLESNGPLTLENAVSVIAQTGEALDHLHSQGLVHRDVKPVVDRRSDVYALGCVLYGCLTTMASFQGHKPALGPRPLPLPCCAPISHPR
ncbi:protein kinase domain-containing protein [Streptosporangium sp. NBC_01469]|uniref:protein kinase domain-containing protein n=1 Tax=Streptosporangium sp. NBC_01469 TaxID=2903898 RepID=UPI002E2AB58A|nr:protein kinase [Streptosporangium sp. NBC_01469]